MFEMFKISGEASHGVLTSNPNHAEAEQKGDKLEAILDYVVGPTLS